MCKAEGLVGTELFIFAREKMCFNFKPQKKNPE